MSTGGYGFILSGTVRKQERPKRAIPRCDQQVIPALLTQFTNPPALVHTCMDGEGPTCNRLGRPCAQRKQPVTRRRDGRRVEKNAARCARNVLTWQNLVRHAVDD